MPQTPEIYGIPGNTAVRYLDDTGVFALVAAAGVTPGSAYQFFRTDGAGAVTEWATLVAGDGVTITNAAGQTTFAAGFNPFLLMGG